MPRISACLGVLFLLIVSIAAGGMAGDSCCWFESGLEFSGDIGLEVTFAPDPPSSYDIDSSLLLSLNLAGFMLASETVFDLSGFQSESFSLDVNLGNLQLGDEVVFDPRFSFNDLSISAQVVGIEISTNFILADIGSVQTPEYSMAAVIELSSGVTCGFSITAITGFGATDLINMLGGVEAPQSYDCLALFYHADSLFASGASPRVSVVSGFYFEQQLVRLGMDYMGLLATSTTWFEWQGFSKEVLEIGYHFEEPSLAFLAAFTIDDSFALSNLDFILDLEIMSVRFTSWTSFGESTPPSTLPIAFSGQGFALGFSVCEGVMVTSVTRFDDTFMFAQQDFAVEAFISPVSLASLTMFDSSGFAGQQVKAEITFSGVNLYTIASFNFTGIDYVTFGFSFKF